MYVFIGKQKEFTRLPEIFATQHFSGCFTESSLESLPINHDDASST